MKLRVPMRTVLAEILPEELISVLAPLVECKIIEAYYFDFCADFLIVEVDEAKATHVRNMLHLEDAERLPGKPEPSLTPTSRYKRKQVGRRDG